MSKVEFFQTLKRIMPKILLKQKNYRRSIKLTVKYQCELLQNEIFSRYIFEFI